MLVNTTTDEVVQSMDYTEFGNTISSFGGSISPFGYAGGLTDTHTNLVRFGARDYNTYTGRWNTKDPLLFAAGQSNLFMYCANDPINKIDPTGLQNEGFGDTGDDFGSWLAKVFGIGNDTGGRDPSTSMNPYAEVN
jgi:RHS repeat-associated protein